ncbi:hypothetical protein [Catellatospora vulcania]|uniref:hypothetical protein n=1 Tax=Catellatospora vulcania TaxID=1460450 RepID=UPI0012D47D0A|nr:hypothetical protein [Catellatospora vulcania]
MNHSGLERAIRNRSAHDVLDLLLAGGLQDIAHGRSELRAVRHPLGFICLPLSRDQSDVGVCVHVWSDADVATRTTSAVHCHSWDLLSFLLSGSILNQTYQVDDDPEGPLRVYEIRSADGHDEILTSARRVRITAGHADIRSSGEYYELPAGHFHASLTRSPESVTVVLGRLREHASDLSLGALDVAPAARPRIRFDAEDTVTIVRDLLARMSTGALTP